ncbi:UNVERIFIED_CONTAM: hypothetical protein K2H54_048874 [Gekko kuhli]
MQIKQVQLEGCHCRGTTRTLQPFRSSSYLMRWAPRGMAEPSQAVSPPFLPSFPALCLCAWLSPFASGSFTCTENPHPRENRKHAIILGSTGQLPGLSPSSSLLGDLCSCWCGNGKNGLRSNRK